MTVMDPEEGRQALLDVGKVLNSDSVPFYLIQGTALGVYRDNGFAPNDNDIDIGTLAEHLIPRSAVLQELLKDVGFSVSTRCWPFTTTRVLVAKRGTVKVDITSYVEWIDKEQKRVRFCHNTDMSTRPYAVVYAAEMMERYDAIEVFGTTFQVPSPIETYLELEYGTGWRVPADDSFSRTRCYDYFREQRMQSDYLVQHEKDN